MPRQKNTAENRIDLMAQHAYREKFAQTYRAVMTLVEDVADYIDKHSGAVMAKLEGDEALHYTILSRNLTTKLMQMSCIMLLLRARDEGDMSARQIAWEHKKITLGQPLNTIPAAQLQHLPEDFRQLIHSAAQLEQRIVVFERMLESAEHNYEAANEVSQQQRLLATALAHF